MTLNMIVAGPFLRYYAELNEPAKRYALSIGMTRDLEYDTRSDRITNFQSDYDRRHPACRVLRLPGSRV